VERSGTSESGRSETELIELATAGDAAAFGEIVRGLEPRVAATVIGLLGRGPDAEDVGQETFIRLFKSLSGFRGDSSLASYATRIAINLCRDRMRQNKRRSQVFVLADDELVDRVPDVRDAGVALADRDFIRRGLQELSLEYREVIVLRLMDGLSTRETAAVLNVPEGTVTSRLARGQMKLREILESRHREER